MTQTLFEREVIQYFNEFEDDVEITHHPFHLRICLRNFIFQIVSIANYKQVSPIEKSDFTIYEDLWFSRKLQLKARLHSILQQNQRKHARLAIIKAIDKPTAERFLHENHLMGYAKCATKLGLFIKDELLAVATFSAGRKMNRLQETERSYELISFASKNYITVVGGLDKLLKHFIRMKQAADIMTYIDCEQGNMRAYQKVGFIQVTTTSPQMFYLNEDGLRIKTTTKNLVNTFSNKGSYKLIFTRS